jgi:hypothetical protein
MKRASLNPGLIDAVAAALDQVGVSWNELVSKAEEIVLFGSRAVGLATNSSDWDLLCIGRGQNMRRGNVEIIWLDPLPRSDSNWLGSELAGHVATYGKWLVGKPEWIDNVFVSEKAVAHKAKKICRRLLVLRRTWDLVGHDYQERKGREIRRDMQRLALLYRGQAIPPTLTLDHDWDTRSSSTELRRAMRALPCIDEVSETVGIILGHHDSGSLSE